jgi:LysM repeat protein
LRGAKFLCGVAALALGLIACASEPKVRHIPTTTPVLTTLRPELTTTTTEKIVQRMAYVVQPGDTLGKIAKGFGVTVADLMTENGKEDTILGIGETLFIPPPSDGTSE